MASQRPQGAARAPQVETPQMRMESTLSACEVRPRNTEPVLYAVPEQLEPPEVEATGEMEGMFIKFVIFSGCRAIPLKRN